MKQLLSTDAKLDRQELYYLNSAVTNYMNRNRVPTKVIKNIETRENKYTNPNHGLLVKMRLKIEKRMKRECTQILGLLEKAIKNLDKDAYISKMMYNKLKGDINRYLLEIEKGKGKKFQKNCMKAYNEAWNLCSHLERKDEFKIELLMSHTTFLNDFAEDQKKAIKKIKRVLNEFKGCEEEYKFLLEIPKKSLEILENA